MTSTARVKKHRASLGQGQRRVEVIVPTPDAEFVKTVAKILRTDPKKSAELRALAIETPKPKDARTAADVFAEIRKIYPPGPPLEFDRDDLLPDRDFSFD